MGSSRTNRSPKGASSARAKLAELRQRANEDDPEALLELGIHLRDGLAGLIRADHRAALLRFRRAAELGNLDAMAGLAALITSRAVGRSPRARRLATLEAMRWERSAAARGNEVARYNLAVSMQSIGMHRDAVRWFRRVAGTGIHEAQLDLAKAELLGTGTRRNVASALKRLQLVAARRSNVSQFDREAAMLALAQVHLDGWLVPRNHAAGVKWLRRAAKMGSNAAAGLLVDLDEE